jgi:hypothetical protein
MLLYSRHHLPATVLRKERKMGARGAVIMGFFGAVFAALTIHQHWQVRGIKLALPFIISLAIWAAAAQTSRLKGNGFAMSEKTKKALLWSSTGEGIGIFLVINAVNNLHRPDLLLPAMALVVGLHFLPIAHAASFRPFYRLATVLLLSAAIGFMVPAPVGGEIAGISAALCLWFASITAVSRERHAKQTSMAQA